MFWGVTQYRPLLIYEILDWGGSLVSYDGTAFTVWTAGTVWTQEAI